MKDCSSTSGTISSNYFYNKTYQPKWEFAWSDEEDFLDELEEGAVSLFKYLETDYIEVSNGTEAIDIKTGKFNRILILKSKKYIFLTYHTYMHK